MRLAAALVPLLLAAGPGAAHAQAPASPPAGPGQITLVCDAVYLPARSNWLREVRFVIDGERIRRLEIDGVPVYSFAVFETVILTALDNERIQIDTATLSWRSDFRGQASSEGRCERR